MKATVELNITGGFLVNIYMELRLFPEGEFMEIPDVYIVSRSRRKSIIIHQESHRIIDRIPVIFGSIENRFYEEITYGVIGAGIYQNTSYGLVGVFIMADPFKINENEVMAITIGHEPITDDAILRYDFKFNKHDSRNIKGFIRSPKVVPHAIISFNLFISKKRKGRRVFSCASNKEVQMEWM